MSVRTDLALEAAKPFGDSLPNGVTVEEEHKDSVAITTVRVTSEEGAKSLGKPMGSYITVETKPFASPNINTHPEIEAMAERLRTLLPQEGLVLVVGLGNIHITPDAIGPRVADQILATRHIAGDSAEKGGLEGFRPVAALAPGVLAQTGIETGEIVASVVRDVRPAAIIVVDALASRALSRLGCTLQIADTGIAPGSGVQNRRSELSRETLGVPVISMGVPTVVDGTTLAHDLLNKPEEDVGDLRQLFGPQGQQMMVTPRDVDLMVERAAKVISLTINRALQPNLSMEDITYLVS